MNFYTDDLNIIQDELQRKFGNQVGVPDPFTLTKSSSTDVNTASNKIGFIKSMTLIGTGSVDINDGNNTYSVSFDGVLQLNYLWINSITNISGLIYLNAFGYLLTFEI